MPFSTRLLAILQLCIAFSLILWYTAQPFMGEYFTLRSQMAIYEYVLGASSLLKSSDQQDKLKRNEERFSQLSQTEQNEILKDYRILSQRAKRPWMAKLKDGLHVLLLDIPSFEFAWLFFSTVIAILFLLRVEGASQAAWILPLIVLAYGVDNRLNGTLPADSPDKALFPTDKRIEREYIGTPLKPGIVEQHQQWTTAWQHYLAEQWASSASYEKSQEERIEEGEFNFNLARIQALQGHLKPNWKLIFHEKISYFTLALYWIWNVFFAWIVNRQHLRSSAQKPVYKPL